MTGASRSLTVTEGGENCFSGGYFIRTGVCSTLEAARNSQVVRIASRREGAPSFVNSEATWCSTVRCEMKSLVAISPFVQP